MKYIETLFDDGNSMRISLHEPDICPLCHQGIDPHIHFSYCNGKRWQSNNCLQVVYRCTLQECDSLFISYYRAKSQSCKDFIYIKSKPIKQSLYNFTKTISEISPTFCTIYNQALFAEQLGLNEICGIGYRKSLEFLIKDYLTGEKPDNKEKINTLPLGNCIKEYIHNDKIKEMAKRAAWLGNDETHYVRKWNDKDIGDLKKLLDATIYWIEIEKISKDYLYEMPEK